MNHFKICGKHYSELTQHLLQDDKESAAIVLCKPITRHSSSIFLCKYVIKIDTSQTDDRSENFIAWSTSKHLLPLSEKIENENLSIFIFHNHPKGFLDFSMQDDKNDLELIPRFYNWSNSPGHGAGIITPNGDLKIRLITEEGNFVPIQRFTLISDQLVYSESTSGSHHILKRLGQSFGSGTRKELSKLKIGIIGCSGTGSIIFEQLYRSGAKSFVLVDPDFLEEKNLNRIINSSTKQAIKGMSKIVALAESTSNLGFKLDLTLFTKPANDIDVITELGTCDLLYCCVDNAGGRHTAGIISSAFLLPLFELGTFIEPDNNGNVSHVFASTNYIQPFMSSLLSREVYTIEQLTAETMLKDHPEIYEDNVRQGYLPGVNEEQHMVMPVNMVAAAMSVNDLLARIHNYRIESNAEHASQKINVGEGYIICSGESDGCSFFQRFCAIGDDILELGGLP